MPHLHAMQIADFAITGGKRWDKISATIHAFSPPETLEFVDKLQAKDIQLKTIGTDIRMIVCNCYVKGNAQWGKAFKGQYRETGDNFVDPISLTTANIPTGNSRDYSVAAGILYPFMGMNVASLSGWSYHYQRVKMQNAVTNGEADEVLNGLSYLNTWQGPWAGIEAQLEMCGFNFFAGYEYHWAHWKAHWKLDCPNIFEGAYTDQRRSKHAIGQVGYFDAKYPLFCSVLLGVGFKYQYWKAQHGREKPLEGTFAEIGLPADEVDKVPTASWQSYGLEFTLDLAF